MSENMPRYDLYLFCPNICDKDRYGQFYPHMDGFDLFRDSIVMLSHTHLGELFLRRRTHHQWSLNRGIISETDLH